MVYRYNTNSVRLTQSRFFWCFRMSHRTAPLNLAPPHILRGNCIIKNLHHYFTRIHAHNFNFCFMYLSHVSCLTTPVSFLLSSVSHLLYHASCLASPVSHCHIFRASGSGAVALKMTQVPELEIRLFLSVPNRHDGKTEFQRTP